MPQKSAAVVHAASKESLATASSKYGTSTISLAKDIGTAPGGNKRLKRSSKAVSHHTYKSQAHGDKAYGTSSKKLLEKVKPPL